MIAGVEMQIRLLDLVERKSSLTLFLLSTRLLLLLLSLDSFNPDKNVKNQVILMMARQTFPSSLSEFLKHIVQNNPIKKNQILRLNYILFLFLRDMV